LIARALTTFHSDYEMVPGRFNVIEVGDIQIITDYGHNAAAMSALMDAAQAMGKRNTIFVGGFPGDRRDEDLIATIMPTVSVVDRYFLYDLTDRRKRGVGEVPNLLKSHLPKDAMCEIVADEHTAIYKAWKAAQPGDRLVIIVDLVDESIEIINQLIAHTAEDDGCTLPISQMNNEVIGK
jgi:cyanophycin synthetase